ncbi:MAG: [FeFe] hydrogenase H-cluster radical SAM maturase HydE [Eubacteriaceae bacterium]|nr:[FeFe] hydrogenase H-cluster radical SAM maturase HydE [Eubacteriaceae bacterium]
MPAIIEKLFRTSEASKEELITLLGVLIKEDEAFLLEKAFEKRNEIYGNSVYVRGLIEFSNYCTATCNYCGLRSDNTIERYRLSEDQIITQCKIGYDFGYRTFVLQSGEDPWYTKDRLVAIVAGIKKCCTDAAVTLSIGERTEEEYQAFFDAGADRFLLRQEAYNKKLYDNMHPGMDHENRISCLRTLKKIGYQTGAGFMVGIKNQTLENIAEDLIFMKELQPDMIGIGPFMPSQNTPYEKESPGDAELTLRVLAITRLLVPHALMPMTTALVSLCPEIRERALKAGSNVIMPNLTPDNGGYKYKLYDNKSVTEGLDQEKMAALSKKIKEVGFDLQMVRGDVIK